MRNKMTQPADLDEMIQTVVERLTSGSKGFAKLSGGLKDRDMLMTALETLEADGDVQHDGKPIFSRYYELT